MMTLEKLMHIHNGLLTGRQQKWMTYGDPTTLDEESDISVQDLFEAPEEISILIYSKLEINYMNTRVQLLQ